MVAKRCAESPSLATISSRCRYEETEPIPRKNFVSSGMSFQDARGPNTGSPFCLALTSSSKNPITSLPEARAASEKSIAVPPVPRITIRSLHAAPGQCPPTPCSVSWRVIPAPKDWLYGTTQRSLAGHRRACGAVHIQDLERPSQWKGFDTVRPLQHEKQTRSRTNSPSTSGP